jgi:superfamily I DNA/RNA helicase
LRPPPKSDRFTEVVTQRYEVPVSSLLKGGDCQLGADAIQMMTMKVSKSLEFPVVALPGVWHMPAPGETEKEAARVFYVAATRATQRLVMGVAMEALRNDLSLN